MSDDNDPIAALAVGLNEDAKVARRGRKPKDAAAAGDGASGLGEAISDLGDTVNAQAGAGTGGLDLSEAAHTGAIERMEAMATDAVFNSKALIYDLRDFMLNQIKARPKPWSATSNEEQRDVAAACEHAAREAVRKTVEAIAANGAQPVRLLLTKIAIGDDTVITAKVKAFTDEESERDVALLHKARGKHVMLTVASVDDYSGDAREAETDPDQPGLGFEAGSDDAGRDPDDADLAG